MNEELRAVMGYVRGCVFNGHHPLTLLDREAIAVMYDQQEQQLSPDRDEETKVRILSAVQHKSTRFVSHLMP